MTVVPIVEFNIPWSNSLSPDIGIPAVGEDCVVKMASLQANVLVRLNLKMIGCYCCFCFRSCMATTYCVIGHT